MHNFKYHVQYTLI